MLLKYLAKLVENTPEQWNFPIEALSPLSRDQHFVTQIPRGNEKLFELGGWGVELSGLIEIQLVMLIIDSSLIFQHFKYSTVQIKLISSETVTRLCTFSINV